MRVIRAGAMGMCFGVRDALTLMESVPEPEVVTIHGELVHNAVVLADLAARGFRMSGEAERGLPATADVLVTAHGISDAERAKLAAAGKNLIDTTCPLVTRAHRAAQGLARLGYHVVVIGKPGHVEVRGVVEDLPSFDVVPDEASVPTYPHGRIGVICQTTSPERQVNAVLEAIRARNPHAEVRFVDTVCRPTKQRQRALERLLTRVEAMVVVGGRNSNNTRELVALCREQGVPAFHVQEAAELREAWFEGLEVVGLTAGTSTLDATIDEVHRALLAIRGGVACASSAR